jgi:hypothetical protein
MGSPESQSAAAGVGQAARLKRLLTVKDLVFFGIVLIQPIAPVGIFGLSSVLNFGDFMAFMGVNLAAISEYYVHRREGKRRIVGDLLVPGLGFLFCLAIWLSLPRPAKIAGGAWILIGLIYDAIRSRGFRVQPARDLAQDRERERGDRNPRQPLRLDRAAAAAGRDPRPVRRLFRHRRRRLVGAGNDLGLEGQDAAHQPPRWQGVRSRRRRRPVVRRLA